MKKTTILLFLLILHLKIICGGKNNFNFLTIGVDARAVSIGDAVVSLPLGLGSVYYNPATLSMLETPSIMFSYRNWMVDGDIIYGAIGINNKLVNIALSVYTLEISNIEIRDKPGEPIGYSSARDIAISFSVSPRLKSKLKFGLTTKYILEKIFMYETNALAADFGFLYTSNLPKFELNLGGVIRNIGTSSSTFSIGASTRYATGFIKMLLTSELRYKTLVKRYLYGFGSGFEYNSLLNFQVGYEWGFLVHSIKFGFGIKLTKICINYAYSPFDYDLPSSHALTLTYKF